MIAKFKNDAVQRLQKLHNELKSVISIYEVSNSSHVDAKPFEKVTEKRLKTIPSSTTPAEENEDFPKTRHRTNETTEYAAFKKSISFIPRPIEDFNHRDSASSVRRTCPSRKPSSAPSSTSSSTANCESDYLSRPPTRGKKNSKSEIENNFSRSGAKSHRFDNIDWLDESVIKTHDFLLSPEKSSRSDKDALHKYNYTSLEDLSDLDQPDCEVIVMNYSEDLESETSSDYFHTRGNPKTIYKTKSRGLAGKKNTTFENKKVTPAQREVKNSSRARSESPRNKPPISKELLDRTKTGCKQVESKKEKPTRNEIPNKIPRLEKHRLESSENEKNSSKPRSTGKEKKIKNDCEESRPGIRGSKEKKSSRKACEETKGSVNTRSKSVSLGKDSDDWKKDDESEDIEETLEPNSSRGGNSDHLKSARSPNNAIKLKKLEGSDFEVHELSRIIEKSNEKLEKMKVSKNLAIDIAKQLKNKYDEIRNSKNKLMDRLQKVEEDNERLNSEIQIHKDSKMQLQITMDEFKMDSKTMLLEQDKKTREILDENACLKERIKKIEKQLFEKMTETQRQTKRFLQKSLEEQSTELDQLIYQTHAPLHKVHGKQDDLNSSPEISPQARKEKENKYDERRESQAQEEVRRLIADKSQLVAKIEELRNLLCDRQSRVEMLENKMKELEDEVKKQRYNLMQKTERLEDTNKELESIRKNSKDLEDQVRILRQSIENFDRMHQNLISKTGDYESQTKRLQEHLEKVEAENKKLKNDLENEKDSLLIKNKIIDDQQETIKQMREKSEEYKALVKKNQSLERLINIEREEKLELQDAVERLKRRKEELKQKIKTLEGDLLVAPQEVVRDLQKTQIVLHELENQVQIKQREWELHLQALIKEKEQACSVAEFATKKLMQTTTEFQKQSEVHKQLHRVLTENLAKEKERHFRNITEKTSHAQLKSVLAETQMEAKKSSRITDRSQFCREQESSEETDIWHTRRTSSRLVNCEETLKFPNDF